ncbi:hypothetical protein T02_3867 [Trichinella nativa]|uniref:Uncharacterized protein n=1 Tax=Trichinella nativa TaxID=6335 RepID=A0A0V1KRA7_9BILA|nr:hypothetical protein T02_3867 [Trichinella nativa]
MSAEDSNKGEDKPANSNSTSEEIEMRIKNNMIDPATFPAHWKQLTTPPLYVQELCTDEDIPTDNEEDFEEILDDEWETECDNEKNEQVDLEELWDGLWEARLEEDDFHASLNQVIRPVAKLVILEPADVDYDKTTLLSRAGYSGQIGADHVRVTHSLVFVLVWNHRWSGMVRAGML